MIADLAAGLSVNFAHTGRAGDIDFREIVANHIKPNKNQPTLLQLRSNLTGNPAMSMPTGFSASGLPLSMQIVGKPFGDADVLRIGYAFEQATGLTGTRPNVETAVAAE